MDLLPGIRSHTIDTGRLRMHYLEFGPADGIPVVLIHGVLSTGRVFEHLMASAPGQYRFLIPDMRGFGDTEPKSIDATRGLRDWADDTYSLVQELGVTTPVHLAGWSTGGAAMAEYVIARPVWVASLTLIGPVPPYGLGTKTDGSPCFPDYAGTGGGARRREFVRRLAAGDRSSESPASPRSMINSTYWSPTHLETKEREDMFVDEILKTMMGDDGYPGDMTSSPNWPGFATGTRGILNALSGQYCNWSGIVTINPKPPILWTQGSIDAMVADGTAIGDIGALGKMGIEPNWPGDAVYPPQPMVSQIRAVLQRYAAAGGRVQMEMFEGSGHAPFLDAAERWSEVFFDFLQSVA